MAIQGNDYSLSTVYEWHAEGFRAYHQGGEPARYMQKVAPATYAFWDKVCRTGFSK